MKHSLADHLAFISATLTSFVTAALTMGVLAAGTVGAVRVGAGHTPVQNPHWRKFFTIAVLSAAGTPPHSRSTASAWPDPDRTSAWLRPDPGDNQPRTGRDHSASHPLTSNENG